MKIPQRVRSKYIFLIYENFSSLDITLEHLKKIFYIEEESDWVYVLRIEKLADGKTNVIAYIELTHPPDILAERWTLLAIKPKISCSSTKQGFLLRYALTFYEKFPPIAHILTNMSEEDILQNSVIWKGIENKIDDETKDVIGSEIINETVNRIDDETKDVISSEIINEVVNRIDDETKGVISSEIINETSYYGSVKRSMKERQLNKFENYYKQFNDHLESPDSDARKTYLELERNLRNMTNYRSTYNMPQNLQDQIRECRGKIAQYKSKYDL